MKLELRGITKRFGALVANDHIDLTVEPGEIHCLLGENGAGKSTLMNVLYGLYQADEGEILLDDEVQHFAGPGDAMAAGIGMVHQHFMLIPVFTVAENVMLGHEQTTFGGRLDLSAARAKVREISDRFGFAVESMSLLSEHHSNETVTFSSTYIRSCVDAGDVLAAADALGRPHRVEGVVVRGYGRGAELGFPTANVAPPMYSAIPADGVYAAWFTVLGHGPVTGSVIPGERYQAAVSVGTNPTFSGRTRTVEAFVLDTTADLYGQHVAVDFVARLRGQLKFESVRDLVEAMGKDTEKARAILSAQD